MKPWLILAILLCLPAAALAQTEAFGRVFFTPQDRTLLDDARRKKVREVPRAAAPRRVAVAPQPVAQPERPSGNVTLNGIVRRSDGEATIWVNGVAMPADAQTGKVQVAPNTSQSGVIRIPNADSAGSVELKVGQKLDLSSGNVTERYTNREPPRTQRAPRDLPPRAIRRPARDDTDTPEER